MAPEKLFELRRRTFDTPHFRGIEFIEVEAKSIINRVPGNSVPFDFTINPYRGCSHACVYCFARSTHTFMDMDAGRDFESKIVVKVNAPDLLRRELARRSWKGGHIAMGTATDPYQRAEGRYRLMPRIIQALLDYRNPFSILTKGTLILRDLPLLKEAAEVVDLSTALSVPTLDAEVWRRSEPGTPHPRKRLDAVARLNEAGIPCGVMIAPVLPGISDDPRMLMEVVKAAVDAGATHITPILLHLRPIVREEYMAWLQDAYPHLVGTYEEMYRRGAYAPSEARKALAENITTLKQAAGGLKPRSDAYWRMVERKRKQAELEKAPAKVEQQTLL
ncbi:MAG TPA: Rv2578c family radical SAM protein [Actinomycetota bacterium]|nr:Rv2578c family radical SAM protein [Actinomycetota bacterium]